MRERFRPRPLFEVLFSGLIAACLALLMPGAGLAQGTAKDLDARAVIIDASGSMRGKSYSRGDGSRWDETMVLIDRFFNELKSRGDTVPTQMFIFGGRYNFVEEQRQELAKPASRREFTTSTSVKPEHPMCGDIDQITTGWVPPSKQFPKDLRAYLGTLGNGGDPKGGMTPQGLAIVEALELLVAQFGPKVTAEVRIFSDFEALNCIDENQTLCDQVLSALNPIIQAGGSVKFGILAVPSSALASVLDQCAPSRTTDHDDGDDEKETIDEYLDTVAVTAQVKAGNTAVLNAGFVDLVGMRFRAFTPGTAALVAGGPAKQPLDVGTDTFDFELTDGSTTWKTTQTITSATNVVFVVDPGGIQLQATLGGAPIAQLDGVEIVETATGRNIGPSGWQSLLARYSVMPGNYWVTGHLGGVTQTVPVNVSAGKSTPVSLSFSQRHSAPSSRAVTLRLDVRQPTLHPSNLPPYDPQVTLHSVGMALKPLTRGSNTLSLEPGDYELHVSSATGHVLQFTVNEGAAPLDVVVVVTPGQIESTAPVSGGYFELETSTGQGLFQLTGDEVRQSLPDGDYRLVHFRPDGSSVTSPVFSVETGEVETVQWR